MAFAPNPMATVPTPATANSAAMSTKYDNTVNKPMIRMLTDTKDLTMLAIVLVCLISHSVLTNLLRSFSL